MKKAGKENRNKNKTPSASNRFRPVAVSGLVTASIIGVGIAAYAANNLLHGHVTITERCNHAPKSSMARNAEKISALKSPASNPKAISELEDKYGTAAASPAVAAAIRNAESAPNAKIAADRQDALQHGYILPGTDPMQAILHGYVPPGMSPQQASMLYNALPKNARMPRVESMTAERIATMAGEPADPLGSLPQGFGPKGVKTANEKMIRGYMRERFGPVYVPPFHRDHNRANRSYNECFCADDRQGSIREMVDSSGNIVAEYGYDPYGQPTRIGGTGPATDFGYQDYYVHQRSGLLLTPYRAYSSALGPMLFG